MFSFLKKSKLLAIPMAIILLFSITTTAFAATKTLSVSQVIQAKSKWCWAACSEMVGKYQNSNSTRDQWAVVAYVKNSTYPNDGGTDSEVVKGIRYASNDTVTYQSGSTLSFASHQSHIDSSDPLVVKMEWDNNGGWHVVVCYGYYTTSSNNYLYLVDPIENTTKSYYDYTLLKNGTSIQSGTGKYITTFSIK